MISTNESYKAVAMRRGRRRPEDVSVLRSGPDTSQMRKGEAVPELRRWQARVIGPSLFEALQEEQPAAG